MSLKRDMTSATGLQAELARRIIDSSQFIADSSAFVDVHLPRSSGKTSYSFIGAGVTQNDDAPTNLVEPHGFCVGAAGLQPRMVNNAHLHYTAEVFVCLSGHWKMMIGLDADQVLSIGPGDVFSVPTWVYRSFENVGPDEGFLFTFLGGDDPGGIIWAPDVLRAARETGFVLDESEKVVRLDDLPGGTGTLRALPREIASRVEYYSDEELASRVIRFNNRKWQREALLADTIGSNVVEVAPVIGTGFNQHRRAGTEVLYPHGFSVNWVRLASGSSSGMHQLAVPAVLLTMFSEVEIEFGGQELVCQRARPGSVVSLPPGTWRNIRTVGDDPAEFVIAVLGDGRVPIAWSEGVQAEARRNGFTVDAGGCIAEVALVDRHFG